MTAETTTGRTAIRPPEPKQPPSGLLYVAVSDPYWRLAREGARCRYHAPTLGARACGEPAVAEASHPTDPISPWWPYCARHARTHGYQVEEKHWVEDGKVLHYALRHPDGTEPTPREAARARNRPARRPADECSTHNCLKAECPPESSHVHTFRLRKDLVEGAEKAVDKERTDVSAWVRQAMETQLGYLRCDRCREDAPPVPLKFGDLTGRTLGKWIAKAAAEVKRQHPRHEPVLIGREPSSCQCDADHQKVVQPAAGRVES
jgi:hypothetical protein